MSVIDLSDPQALVTELADAGITDADLASRLSCSRAHIKALREGSAVYIALSALPALAEHVALVRRSTPWPWPTRVDMEILHHGRSVLEASYDYARAVDLAAHSMAPFEYISDKPAYPETREERVGLLEAIGRADAALNPAFTGQVSIPEPNREPWSLPPYMTDHKPRPWWRRLFTRRP